VVCYDEDKDWLRRRTAAEFFFARKKGD